MTGITRTRAGSQTRGYVALDVGGVNTKAARLAGSVLRTATRPLEVWKDRAALVGTIAAALAAIGAGHSDPVALTMTAELSDAFATKREGVGFVLDAATTALGGRAPAVLSVSGELIDVARARTRALEVASANWVATALLIAALHPDALIIDVGSTTTDLIPIAGGRLAAVGRTDLERLMAGELVYTGALRTNVAALAGHVPLHGELCPVASECFAISADVHLILGHIAPEEYLVATPDGRPATVELARRRLARLVCADLEQLDRREVDGIAAYLHAQQLRQIELAARRAAQRCSADAPVIALGAGAFLGRMIARRIGRPLVEAPERWGDAGARVAPAAALAELLAKHAGKRCLTAPGRP